MPNLIERFVDFFIITFGITRPEPGRERTAAVFIVALMIAILALLVTGVFVLIRVIA